jgi:hypothetical protein
VPDSILEAIRQGIWDYEPAVEAEQHPFDATRALPGTEQKLEVLAERVRQGLPLWHDADRRTYDESNED